MQAAEPREFGVFKARDHAEDAHLLGVLELGLKAHHVVERAQSIVLPELHDGIGLDGRIVGVGQPHRLHGAVTRSLRAAFGHDFDRQAAVEIGRALPLFELGLAAIDQRLDESLVARLVHRTVDVVLAGAARADLVVTRLEPADVHVDGIEMDDRRNGVKEGKRIGACPVRDGLRQGRRGQRPSGDDRLVPIVSRNAGNFFPGDLNQRMRLDPGGDSGGETVAIDCQRAAGRDLVCVAGRHDERTSQAHFGVQKPNRVVFGVVGTK